MEIQLAGIVNDSIVDGDGVRLTVFVQGCSHHCRGCHNPQTWDYSGGYISNTDEIVRIMESNPLLDGITLSGGEPFMQVEACAELARQARKRGLSVWCYTGFTLDELMQTNWASELYDEIDVLVDGRFVQEQRSLSLKYRGSSNQRLIDMKKTLKYGKIVLLKSENYTSDY